MVSKPNVEFRRFESDNHRSDSKRCFYMVGFFEKPNTLIEISGTGDKSQKKDNSKLKKSAGESEEPTSVRFLPNEDVVAVSCGGNAFGVLYANGEKNINYSTKR